MKFSFSLLKKLVPAVKSKKDLIEKLNFHFFEAEDSGGNVLDVSIPSNRFSDAASHWGIAKEISAILNTKINIWTSDVPSIDVNVRTSDVQKFKIEIQDKNFCPRYTAQYFENIKVVPSPKWMQKILIDCGLRPINNVVDIMNYAMLETGQPLHAFDYDKIEGENPKSKIRNPKQTPNPKFQIPKIVIRRAKKGEKITTLENKTYQLDENVLVIADIKEPLAIAGIKGGKLAEVDKNTGRIVVESANFNGVNIYKASKTLKLSTDASLRFSHNISPELTIIGINRVAQLLKEITGAKIGPIIDVNFTKPRKKIIKFDVGRFNKFIGVDLNSKTCQKYLECLGFKITKNLVEVPLLRDDIESFEDLAEEVIRLYGYNRLKSLPPHIHLHPSGFEDQIILKSKIKKVLIGFGLNEVYNYSFIGEDDLKLGSAWKAETIELENPVSSQFKYLRPSLAAGLLKNINSNFRFFDEVRIFEIGNIFFKNEQGKFNEKSTLGIALASKTKKGEVFFELKGIIEELFKKIGLVSYLMPELSPPYSFLISGEALKIESDGEIIGYFGKANKELLDANEGVVAEIDLNALLKLVEEEHEYLPLPKYPSVMRDISILVEPSVRVGEIMQAIQSVDFRYVEDVDLIDEYEFVEADERGLKTRINADKINVNQCTHQRKSAVRRSLTFRIIFQAQDRTLTDKEVNQEMEKITKMLKNKFRVIIR